MKQNASARPTAALLSLLAASEKIHFDHYAGHQLGFACLNASGIHQQLLALDGPTRGQVYEVMDCSGAYGSACLGAAHPVIAQTLVQALQSDGYVTDELGSLARAELLNDFFGPQGLWCDHFEQGAYWVSGRNSGSEGMELALRLLFEQRIDPTRMRLKQDFLHKNRILAFEGAWHGWTQGVLPLLNRRHFTQHLPTMDLSATSGIHVDFIPFNEPALLDAYMRDHGQALLGVILEPVQGDAGILTPQPGYLRQVATACKKNGAFLVADEVLTFAKTGYFFAMRDAEGPIPTDITVIGKSLGMGTLSVSMVIARKQFYTRACGAVATSDLRPLTCRLMASGVRFIHENNLLQQAKKHGAELRAQLHTALVTAFPDIYREVRGEGFLNGIELTENTAQQAMHLRKNFIQAGVYVELMAGAGRRSGGLRYINPTVRIAPPLTTTPEALMEMVKRLHRGTQRFKKGAL